MNLYRPGTCRWCFDYGDPPKSGEFLHRELSSDGISTIEYLLCDSCNDFSCEVMLDMAANGPLPMHWTVEHYEPEKVLWHRGQKIQIVLPTRAPQTGVVIHSYLSRANFEWMVNCVIDGRKWPCAYPARFVEEYEPMRRTA